MTSPITYYGGKKSIITHYLDLVPVHDTYVEPFVGGGELFWQKDPVRNETINDINGNVVNFYRVLKLKYKALKRAIDATLYSRQLHRKAYKIYSHPGTASDVQRAWAFWMRANFSHSNKIDGGLRFSADMGSLPPSVMLNKKQEFTDRLAARLERTYIECDDALHLLRGSRNVDTGFYELDPPYFFGDDTRPADQGHYRRVFKVDQYEDLLNWCAHECKGKFILHNYKSAMLDRFIKVHGWQKKEVTHRIKAPRKSGPTKLEMIVWNYSTPCGTLNLFS